MTELKQLLVKAIKSEIGDEKDIAIFFSAGTDSLTCLFSCLELNLKPKLYTFHLESYVSEDAKMAKKIAKFFNLDLTTIVIKEDLEELKKDITTLIKNFHIENKIRMQILYPFPHMLKNIKEKIVLTGLSADTLYGTNYHSKIHFLEDFTEERRHALEEDEIDGYDALKKMVENHKKKLIAPYRNKDVIEYFLKFSWDELNKPIQKKHSVEAFKKYFELHEIYRQSSSLPINSKIREWEEKLLDTDLNQLNRESIEELYHDILIGKVKL